MVVTIIDGVEYPLATTLRVAYKVQGEHNHKPYNKIFSEVGSMCIEDQVGILYCAFSVANVSSTITKKQFLDYYLDHMNLKQIMMQLKAVIQAITGFTDEEANELAAKAEAEGNQGN